MQKLLRQLAYWLLVLPAAYLKQLGSQWNNEYFFADLHATAKGNTLLATQIVKGLEILLTTATQDTAP